MATEPNPGENSRPQRTAAGSFLETPAAHLERSARLKLIRSLCLFFAVALIIIALVDNVTRDPHDSIDSRSTFSFRADGFYGIFEVLHELGFESRRHRRSYAQLPDPEKSVLVLIDPTEEILLSNVDGLHVGRAQYRELTNWIEKGGQAVFAPRSRSAIERFAVNTRKLFENRADSESESEPSDSEPDSGSESAESYFELPQPSTEIFSSVLGNDFPRRRWVLAAGPLQGELELEHFRDELTLLPEDRTELVSAYLKRTEIEGVVPVLKAHEGPGLMEVFDADLLGEDYTSSVLLGEDPLVVSRALGDGRAWLLSSSYPFTNMAIAHTGSARLLASLLDVISQEGRRHVYFDEYCHGLMEKRGLLGWITGSNLIYPASAILIFFALFFWRGAVRFGAARTLDSTPRRAKEEYVLSLADIALRAQKYGAAARWIVDFYRGRILAQLGLSHERGSSEGVLADLQALSDRTKSSSFREKDLRQVARDAQRIHDEFDSKRHGPM